MTTVAISLLEGRASSDSWCNVDGAPLSCTKMWKLNNGDMFFESGHQRPLELALKWAESRWAPEEREEEWRVLTAGEDYSFAAILVQTDGKVQYVQDDWSPFYVSDDVICLGSGAAYARGALAMGATTKQAIAIASQFDDATGGRIQTTKLPFKRKATPR